MLHSLNECDSDRRTQLCDQIEIDRNIVSQLMWSLLLTRLPHERGVQRRITIHYEIESTCHATDVTFLRDVNNNALYHAQKGKNPTGNDLENMKAIGKILDVLYNGRGMQYPANHIHEFRNASEPHHTGSKISVLSLIVCQRETRLRPH
ncbi:hypothetical protein TNCV_3111961 [Trichonephila clavipes]|nr:hypothetical protein TNCV_3111961 [Trichonephila clavipes]